VTSRALLHSAGRIIRVWASHCTRKTYTRSDFIWRICLFQQNLLNCYNRSWGHFDESWPVLMLLALMLCRSWSILLVIDHRRTNCCSTCGRHVRPARTHQASKYPLVLRTVLVLPKMPSPHNFLRGDITLQLAFRKETIRLPWPQLLRHRPASVRKRPTRPTNSKNSKTSSKS